MNAKSLKSMRNSCSGLNSAAASSAATDNDLSYLFAEMSKGVVYFDTSGCVKFANPAATKILGISPDQLFYNCQLHHDWHLIHLDGSYFSPEENPFYLSLIKGEPSHDITVGLVNPAESRVKWLSVSSIPHLEDGKVRPFQSLAFIFDITDSILLERELREQKQYTDSIIAAIPELIFILDHKGDFVEFRSGHIEDLAMPPEMFLNKNISEVMPKELAHSFHKAVSDIVSGSKVRHLKYEMSLHDVLNSYEASLAPFGNDKIIVVARNVTMLKQAQQELVESNRKMSMLMDNLHGVAYRCRNDQKWTMEFLSKGIDGLTGYPADDFVDNARRDYNSVIHPDDREYVWNEIQKGVAERRSYTIEYRIVTGEGKIKWVWEKGRGVFDGERLVCLEGFISDISDRKQAESEARRSHEMYRSLINSSDAAIFMIDSDGRYLYLNDFAAKLLKRMPEEIVGMTVQQMLSHEESERVLADVREVIQNNCGKVFEDKLELNGDWYRISIQPVRNESGAPYASMVSVQNINDAKVAELKIVQSELNYRSLFYDSPEAYMIIDDGVFVDCNKASETMMNNDRTAIIGRTPDAISPEYQPNGRKSAEYARELVSSTFETGRSTFEWVHQRPDGSQFLAIVHLAVIELDQRRVLFVTWRDITLRRRAEEQIRKLSSAVQQSPVSIIMAGVDGRVTYANQAACDISGYAQNELIGRQFESLRLNQLDREKLVEFRQSCKPGQKMTGIFQNRKKNGETIWVSSSISSIVDEAGKVTNLVFIGEDVTEKRRTQEALAIAEQRFRQVSEISHSVVWENTIDGLYTYMDPGVEKVMGYLPEEIVGKMHFYDLHPEDSREEFKKMGLEIMRSGQSFSGLDNQLVTKDGRTIWVATSGTPLFDENGVLTGYRGADHDITPRKLAEEEFRTFKTISDEANFGAVLSTLDGILTYSNNTFARMHGWEPAEIMGKHLSMLHTEEQMPRVRETIALVQKNGGFSAEEVPRVRRDGSTFVSLMNSQIIFDDKQRPQFMFATVIDITELKSSEAEIRKFRLAIEQSPVAMVVTDLKGVILYTSPAFSAITGYSAEEALGKPTSILKSGTTSREVYTDLWHTIEAGRTWCGEWQNRKKSGELYLEKATISPVFDEKGRIINFVAVKEDITERRQAEENRIAREAAEEASRVKSAFLSNMSHEIRTPLNAIIGFSQILKNDTSLDAKQSEQIKTIWRSGEHLLELINDILDLSKIEAGQLKLNMKDFCLTDLLLDVENMFRMTIENKGLEFFVQKQQSLPEYINGDSARLRQIAINLLGNSVKFTRKGSITLRAGICSDSPYCSTESDEVCLMIEVADTGIGIPDEFKPHIFEAFAQTSVGSAAGGTGLGLPICLNIARQMGGDLEFTSQAGKGTVFVLKIPVRIAAAGSVIHDTHTSEKIERLKPESCPCRILVVDDRQENRDLLRAILEPVGFSLEEAVNGQEALTKFEQWSPHAVLMDMRMPVMDGYEATKKLKASEKGKNTPVIAITASSFGSDEQKVLEAGANGYIRKPFKPPELFGKLAGLLKLEFITADENVSAGQVKRGVLTRESMICLPSGLIANMSQAVALGKMTKLRELIAEAETIDTTLAAQLQALADSYDYDRLAELFKQE